MFVKGTFEDAQIDCILRENGKKEISHNGILYERKAEHIGKFPAVMISPDDTILINGHSDVRRRFLDILLSQRSPTYLQELIEYNKYLAQRNALLKSSKHKTIDVALHTYYKNKLIEHATSIYETRKEVVELLLPLVQNFYTRIAGSTEQIGLRYRSHLLDDNMSHLLKMSEDKDFITQRTNVGVHKDDLIFFINSAPMKQHASQGQKKSFLFAIKLAEYALLKKIIKKHPILLLDDVFEKLDGQRSQLLIDLILELETQIFITDTHKHRLEHAFKHNKSNVQFEKIE